MPFHYRKGCHWEEWADEDVGPRTRGPPYEDKVNSIGPSGFDGGGRLGLANRYPFLL
jgi:hypothetical protein